MEQYYVKAISTELGTRSTAKADKYGKVMFETNLYSSSPKLAKECVYLEITSDTITIMDKRYNPVVSHPRLYGKDGESMNWLPYISLMAKRPTAIKYTGFYQELPEIWKNYLSELPLDKKREALLTLNAILQKHDIAAAADALEITLEAGTKDCDSILVSYHRLTSTVQPLQPMQLKNPYIQAPSFRTDNSEYDSLFSREVGQ